MKKMYFVFLIAIIFVLTGCKNDNMYAGTDINMVMKDGTLTKNSATIIITDLSQKKNVYGLWFRIDKKEKNKWKELKSKGSFYNTISYGVDEKHKLEMEHNWKDIYGDLPSGEYRLLKEVDNQYIAVEFRID